MARCAPVEDLFEDVFGDALLAVSRFEDGQVWLVTALTAAAPGADLVARLGLVLQTGEILAAPVAVPQQDWVAKVQRDMPPISAGRYWVYGSHVTQIPPSVHIPILVDAASAFGTGHHESTKGCLLALDWMSRHLRPKAILDVGTGTGILAVAAAKTWRVPVLASDNDPEAIRVANRVVRQNGVATLVRCVVAEGVAGRTVAAGAPFDLITANILARPLASLAPAIARCAARDARLVLSGILAVQTAQVTAAYRAVGFVRTRTLNLGEWVTLEFRRP
ncbi:MAG: 50S ribosomal protein L11 methyltransferase [Alphaproteobacteria bacterium]|nr:50S ribosomal protein L11 methyltransferase [Alphaproteobacteria bacterium]